MSVYGIVAFIRLVCSKPHFSGASVIMKTVYIKVFPHNIEDETIAFAECEYYSNIQYKIMSSDIDLTGDNWQK